MLGEKIKHLRNEKGLTQKELADKLFVTPQAVSRWENNEVEPSVSTLTELAKIFNITVSELLGEELPQSQTQTSPQTEVPSKTQSVPQGPVLAVCEQCNKPLYEGGEIVRIAEGKGEKRVLCVDCHKNNQIKVHDESVAYGISQRIKSFVWSGIITVLLLIFTILMAVSGEWETDITVTGIICSVLWFPFISCLFLKNNFIGNMVGTIASWGFVQFPNLIFELDLDGILWFLTVKLLFWVLGFLLAVAFFIVGVLLGILLSVFVYPFALVKNICHPEKSERI